MLFFDVFTREVFLLARRTRDDDDLLLLVPLRREEVTADEVSENLPLPPPLPLLLTVLIEVATDDVLSCNGKLVAELTHKH